MNKFNASVFQVLEWSHLMQQMFNVTETCHFFHSYTGTENPESMVFGMILNTEGFLGKRHLRLLVNNH